MNEQIQKAYDLAVAEYAAIGVDVNKALAQLDKLNELPLFITKVTFPVSLFILIPSIFS